MSSAESTARSSASAAEVIGYVLLATALCGVVASLALLGAIPAEMAGIVVPFAQLTPALTALIFWRWGRGSRRPLREVLALRWSWRGVGLGLAAVAVISALQLALGLALGWTVKQLDVVGLAAVAVVPFLILQAVFAIGEELGWRGWLATSTAVWSFPAAALTSSLAWSFWHLPAVTLLVGGGAGWDVGAAYVLSIASWAPFLLALRRATGSVWAAVATHGALNSLRVFFLQSIPQTDGGVVWSVEAFGWVLWIAAAWWLARRTAAPLRNPT